MRHPRGQVPRSGFLTGSDLWGSLIEKELEVSGTYLVSGDTIIPMDDEDTTLIMTEQKKKSSYGRRVCDFEVTDRIKIFASGNDKLAKIITDNILEIMGVTLANEIIFTTNDNARDWDINGEKISLAVEKI